MRKVGEDGGNGGREKGGGRDGEKGTVGGRGEDGAGRGREFLGRTLLRALVFGTLFLPHFGVQRQSLCSKETMLKPCFG